MARRKFVVALKLCAAVLAICMATLPVCSARCAAQACAVPLLGDRTGAGCHHSSSHSDSPSLKDGAMGVSCAEGELAFMALRPEQDSPAKKSSSRAAMSEALLARACDLEDRLRPAPSDGIATHKMISPVSVSQAPLRL